VPFSVGRVVSVVKNFLVVESILTGENFFAVISRDVEKATHGIRTERSEGKVEVTSHPTMSRTVGYCKARSLGQRLC